MRAALWLIRAYQRWVSPWRLPSCRFWPTCSEYAYQAIAVHGLWRGLGLAAWRLVRCGPWHPGGFDPVPGRGEGKSGGVA